MYRLGQDHFLPNHAHNLFNILPQNYIFWMAEVHSHSSQDMAPLTFLTRISARGSAVITALSYQPQGHAFQTWWGELIFPIYLILPAALDLGIYSASNRNENQITFLGSKARPARKADNLATIYEPIA
jgi:hypothetical protein